MIDFTNLPHKQKCYAGANGGKLSIVYKDEQYMLKFPAGANKNKELSYANGCISEYIGCHIFEIIGIPVQKTLLGTYSVNGKEKVVVACRDFTSVGVILQDFASLKNTIIDSERNGYGTELHDIYRAIEEQRSIEPHVLKEWFWDTFVVDALIGNWDRHNGNWGFLYNIETDSMTIAPIYDCGSSLYPQADEEIMRMTLENKSARDYRVFNIPKSSIKDNGEKINYFDFISSLKNEDCNRALKRITPRIDLSKICYMIDNTPYISELQKAFYKTMIIERKEKILDYSLNKLKSIERDISNNDEKDTFEQLINGSSRNSSVQSYEHEDLFEEER